MVLLDKIVYYGTFVNYLELCFDGFEICWAIIYMV